MYFTMYFMHTMYRTVMRSEMFILTAAFTMYRNIMHCGMIILTAAHVLWEVHPHST